MTTALEYTSSEFPLPVELKEQIGMAKFYSGLPGVPKQYLGKEKDILLILLIAKELNVSPFVALKNISVINGTANIGAGLAISLAHRSGIFDSRIRFEHHEGDGWEDLRTWAVATIAGEEVRAEANIKMAIAEGWTRNPKYKSMPKQMLSYRAATFLINAYAPEVLRGIDVDHGSQGEPIKIDPVEEINKSINSENNA